MAKRGLVPVPSEAAALWYRDPAVSGSALAIVPGVGSFRETGGDAPTRDVVGFEGTSTLTGRSRVPTVECDVSAYLPHLKAWRDIRQAALDQRALEFRLTTPLDTIFTGDSDDTLAITMTTGAFVIAEVGGDGAPDLLAPQYAPGLCFVTAADVLYVIESIATKLTGTVLAADGSAPSADVAAAPGWKIIRPTLIRGPFAAKVANTDRSQLASESNLLSALRLQPLANLPQWLPSITDPAAA